MAAVNFIKNRRCQKERERERFERGRFEQFLARCLDGRDEVSIEKVVEIFENINHVIDEKEMENLSSIAKDDMIPKEKFEEFCRNSRAVKNLLEGSSSSTPSSVRRLKKKDKAAMAFKAVDADKSGFLDKKEFSNFTRAVSPVNRDRLFTNMDKDGDGKIDFQEFQVLFQKK